MNEELKILIALQKKDIILDELRSRAEAAPSEIEALESSLNQSKASKEDQKQDIKKLQVVRKEKEIELETKEDEIKKHNLELNAIKTNDAYKALLSEIDKCKQVVQVLEDEILEIMDKVDKENLRLKQTDENFKHNEAEVKSKTEALKKELEQLKKDISVKEAERAEFAKKVSESLLVRYEYIRESKQGLAIVPVEGENCGGCSITLRPQTINEVCKAQELVVCDSCSRILYRSNDHNDAEPPKVVELEKTAAALKGSDEIPKEEPGESS